MLVKLGDRKKRLYNGTLSQSTVLNFVDVNIGTNKQVHIIIK